MLYTGSLCLRAPPESRHSGKHSQHGNTATDEGTQGLTIVLQDGVAVEGICDLIATFVKSSLGSVIATTNTVPE